MPRPTKVEVRTHLESPGTKVYTRNEARTLVRDAGFVDVKVWTALGPGDLLAIKPRSKYGGLLYRFIWKVYPRWMIRLLGHHFGLYLLIETRRDAGR